MQPHWAEYLIEAALLGTFMFVACTAVLALEHPGSPIHRAINSRNVRRVIIATLMGLTAISLIYSPWGQRSGAHMNPATTFTFFLLGKVRPLDAVAYIMAQFAGGAVGVMLARGVLGPALANERVRYASTTPGRLGIRAAFAAECGMSFTMMSMVLISTNNDVTKPYTGLAAGVLVTSFITFLAPVSGMSMNPARTLASAAFSRQFRGLWVYLLAPPLAMSAAAALHVAIFGKSSVHCCKLQHPRDGVCIFKCRE
ncbi:MAG: aquaporin [Planctomycetota bacterium]|nr:aquaporin [Planctomycetota bacterium]